MTLMPPNDKNFPVADKHNNADRHVNDENIDQLIVDWYQSAHAEVGIDQPERVRHSDEYSSDPSDRNGPLQRAVGELGLIV